MKNPFAVSHIVITIAEVFGWIVVLVGLIMLATAGIRGQVNGFMAFLAIYAVLGFAVVTLVQMARAQIATAENTAKMLALMSETQNKDDAD